MTRIRLLAALAVVAFVAAACGGSDDGADRDEEAEPTAAPTTAAPTTAPPTTTAAPTTAAPTATAAPATAAAPTTTAASTTTAAPTTTAPPATTAAPTTTAPPATTVPPTTTAPPATTATAAPAGGEPAATAGEWIALAGGDDCICADGSDYHYWVREADPSKLVFYLQGGGACFNQETCSFTGEANAYKTNTDISLAANNPSEWDGIFDFDNPLNPLRDHSFVVALYCTGDVHLGDRTYDYGNDVLVHHNGFVNANTALTTAFERFGGATEVVVAGSSAGSASAALYGGLAADLLPDASVDVVADASGAYPSDPGINSYIGGLWGTIDVAPDWPVNEGLTVADYGLPELFIRAGTHAPRIRFARYDNAFDSTQEFFAILAGFDASSIDQLMYQNEALIETAGVNQASYMAPGADHTILYRELLYTQEVEGVAFLDWLTAFLGGTDVDDVACVDCS